MEASADFELLFPVIRAILAVPCTSAPAESLFSSAKQVISLHRTRLSANRARQSIMVAENVHLFGDEENFCTLVASALS